MRDLDVKLPLISVIMPVFNGGCYLSDAIDSVLKQEHGNWELLIIDDGSVDNSLAIAKSYDDRRIKVFSQSNKGVSNARNVGLSSMRGDFFCFLDADDVLPVQSLSVRLKCFCSHDIYFVDGSVEVFDASLTQKKTTWTPACTRNVLKSLVRLDGRCFFGNTWLVRRDHSINYKFDEALTHGEDLFFYMIHAHLGKYIWTNDVILKYRVGSQSAMRNLEGLANGYSSIRSRLRNLHERISIVDRIFFEIRSRKIVFLSFVQAGDTYRAFHFLFFGSIAT